MVRNQSTASSLTLGSSTVARDAIWDPECESIPHFKLSQMVNDLCPIKFYLILDRELPQISLSVQHTKLKAHKICCICPTTLTLGKVYLFVMQIWKSYWKYHKKGTKPVSLRNQIAISGFEILLTSSFEGKIFFASNKCLRLGMKLRYMYYERANFIPHLKVALFDKI